MNEDREYWLYVLCVFDLGLCKVPVIVRCTSNSSQAVRATNAFCLTEDSFYSQTPTTLGRYLIYHFLPLPCPSKRPVV